MKRLTLLLGVVLLCACGGDPQEGDGTEQQERKVASFLPGSIGQNGEVVVVMDKRDWQGKTGDVIRGLIEGPYVLLPQPESLFLLTWQPEDFFYKYYKKHHSILWVETGDNLNNLEARITVQEDLYAENQRIFKLFAKNGTELKAMLDEKGDALLKRMADNALQRIQVNAEINVNRKLRDSLKTELNISLTVPRNFQLVADRPGFKWYRLVKTADNPQLDQGIFVYDFEYTEDSTFTPNFLIAARDSVLRKHVPGVSENAFMSTEFFYPPQFSEINRNDQYTTCIKGLWVIADDFRGGPFVSMTALDEANNRVITTEAYVYAPHEKKREHMRYMEAILLTGKIGK